MGGLPTSLLSARGFPILHGGGQNQNRPTNGRFRYITLAVLRVPNASEQETKSELAHITRGLSTRTTKPSGSVF